MAIEDYLGQIQNYTAPAQSNMDSAYNTLAQVTGDASTLPNKLKEALQNKLNYNEDLIGQQNQAMADYIAAPAQARSDYSNVWDPFKREALVAQARASAYKPYATYADLLNQRMGQVSDIVGEGVSGWQGIINQAQALASLAQQKYQNAWNQYTQAASMQQTSDAAATARDQWEQEMAWNKEKFAKEQANKTGSGTADIVYSGGGAVDPTVEAMAQMYIETGGNVDIPSKYVPAVLTRVNELQQQAAKVAYAQETADWAKQQKLAEDAKLKRTNVLSGIGDFLKNTFFPQEGSGRIIVP